MNTSEETVGGSGHELRSRDSLIASVRSDGSVGCYAECPGCRTVVGPD